MNTSNNTPVHLTESSLANAIAASHDRPVLVDFWAPWCGPCKALGPVIDQLAAESGDKALITKLDIDDAPEAAAAHAVRSIPTLIVFRHGKEAARLVGLQSAGALRSAISAAA